MYMYVYKLHEVHHIEVDNFDVCQADRDLKVSVAGGLIDKRSEEP